MRKAVVFGAGGFIAGHLVTSLKKKGYWVRGVDIKWHEYKKSDADEFIVADLRDPKSTDLVLDETIDEVYQLAADMGGATYIFTGENDANVMHNSTMLNLNTLESCVKHGIKKVFYSSSACVYPEHNQLDPDNPNCKEDTAYPANPDSEYGWEKLYSERLYFAFSRNYGIDVRVARFHNIYGPFGTWDGGKEKAPAAMCRKVAMAKDGDEIEVHGDGQQTRSFLIVSECVRAILALMESSDYHGPVNIGSDEMVTINHLAQTAIDVSGKKLKIKNSPQYTFTGVRGRNSDNTLIKEKLGINPYMPLHEGMEITYKWVSEQVEKKYGN
jgi:nucleoside-diphosphate-sugar epimerase